jgi:predicted esterase
MTNDCSERACRSIERFLRSFVRAQTIEGLRVSGRKTEVHVTRFHSKQRSKRVGIAAKRGVIATNPSDPVSTDLAPPAGEGDTGGSSPAMPDPAAEGTESEPAMPEPGAPAPEGGASPAVPSAGCGQTRTLQDGNQTITSGGMQRQYFLETPDDYDNTLPHRVVFMFHWNFGSINAIVNPPDADRNTDRPFYGMGDLSDNQTIFVVPQGLISNTGGAGWPNTGNRDVNFTDDMLAAISSDLCIDESRVFTTGFSFGAGMSVALACLRPDKFRAAAVYAPGFISGINAAQCTTAIPFFQVHGVDDQVLNFQRGLDVLSVFTGLNGSTAVAPPTPSQDGHTCVSFEGCSFPTRFCSFGAGQGNPINNLRGHYPSPKDPGQSTSWVPAEAWDFITQF